jgi:osmotically-inducible protein OsmY
MTALKCAILAIAAFALVGGCSREREDEASSERAPPPKVAAAQPNATPARSEAPSPAAPLDAVTDSIISSRVKAGILADPGMTGSDVSVNTDHGVVSLTGIIKSQEQAAIASAHAQRQDGVMRVDNQLAVNLH